MRRPIFIVLLLLGMIAQVRAADVTLSVCKLGDQRYQFAFTGDVIGWTFNNAARYNLDTLQAEGDGVEFIVYYRDGGSESIFGDPDAPPCADQSAHWQPSAPSILIPAPDDGPYLLDIWDGWHWSRVTDAAHPDGIVLYNHAGSVELIGSAGQDTDPAHYRLIEVTP